MVCKNNKLSSFNYINILIELVSYDCCDQNH